MRLSKDDAALMNRHPDLKAARMRCLARRRSALARLATLPTRGGSKDVQLDRWTAKHSLRCDNPDVYVKAARLREQMLISDPFVASNAYS